MSSSNADLDEARLLLRKAYEDEAAARKLSDDAGIADSVVGFHAQQAAEKAVKAVLAANGVEFALTHDIRHLFDELESCGVELSVAIRDSSRLTPWAVEFRYGDTADDQLDRASALKTVDHVLEWAEAEVSRLAASAQAE